MKGLTIMTEEGTGKKIAQIDLSMLIKHSAEFEEFMDRLIAEDRKGEKDISWNAIKKDLKKRQVMNYAIQSCLRSSPAGGRPQTINNGQSPDCPKDQIPVRRI